MSCRCAPAAHAAAAAASALATFIRALPPNVAGIRWVYSTGMIRGPWRSTIWSPSGVCRTTNAAPPRPVKPSTRSKPRWPFSVSIENRITRPAALGRQARDVRIVRVQDRRAGPRHRLDEHALDVRELAQRVDAAEPEVVRGDVGHDRHVRPVEAEALAQDAAARHLEHAGVDRRVLEDHPRRLRAGHVAAPDHPPVDHDAVGRGHPDPPAHQLQDVGDHPDGRRLPVRAGHAR